MPPPTAPRVTTKDLERYYELDEQRKSLARQAKDLEALQEELKVKFEAFVRVKGGPERAYAFASGHRLSILEKRESVGWKGEFLRVAGPEEAERLVREAPMKEVLQIEPPKKEPAG